MALRPDIPSAGDRRRMRQDLSVQQETLARIMRRFPHLRRGRPDLGGEGVPVTPDRPGHLSGGAAAALEFGED